MKYDLSNRPSVQHEPEFAKWFEGFETELRDHCKHCGLCSDPIDKVNCSVNDLIRKILGETK